MNKWLIYLNSIVLQHIQPSPHHHHLDTFKFILIESYIAYNSIRFFLSVSLSLFSSSLFSTISCSTHSIRMRCTMHFSHFIKTIGIIEKWFWLVQRYPNAATIRNDQWMKYKTLMRLDELFSLALAHTTISHWFIIGLGKSHHDDDDG